MPRLAPVEREYLMVIPVRDKIDQAGDDRD
jgi:hypothetical protein